jgi:putative transposase
MQGGFGERRSTRLPKYDYASRGTYFVTVCARNMECVFGSVGSDSQVTLSDWGHVVETCWLAIPEHFPGIALDARVTMPNHLHGIVVVEAATTVGARATHASQTRARHASPLRTTLSVRPRAIRRSLGVIVGSFKSAVTKRIREMGAAPDEIVWQRNYYEHIIRDEDDLQRIRRYIETNPTRWAQRAH